MECDYCGRDFSWPSPGCQNEQRHMEPDHARQIAEQIEDILNGRNHVGWSMCDEEIQEEIRRQIADLIRPHLKSNEKAPL